MALYPHMCVSQLQEITPFLRVLGTYPMDTQLGNTVKDDEMMNARSEVQAAAAVAAAAAAGAPL
jgi:hypothetical protein